MHVPCKSFQEAINDCKYWLPIREQKKTCKACKFSIKQNKKSREPLLLILFITVFYMHHRTLKRHLMVFSTSNAENAAWNVRIHRNVNNVFFSLIAKNQFQKHCQAAHLNATHSTNFAKDFPWCISLLYSKFHIYTSQPFSQWMPTPIEILTIIWNESNNLTSDILDVVEGLDYWLRGALEICG